MAMRPKWVYPNATFDLDFLNKRWFGGYVDQKGSEDKWGLCTDGGGYTTTSYTPQRSGILKVGIIGGNIIVDSGLCIQRGAVNNCLQSRDLTQAVWNVVTNATVAKNQVGNDNVSIAASTNSCSSITATSTNALVTQSITLVSRVVIFSAYVKRLTGTGTVSITQDGIAFTDITSQINTTGYTLVQIPQATLSAVVCGFQLATSGDAIAVDFCQLETSLVSQHADLTVNSRATTPLPCTTVTVSRGNEGTYFQRVVTVGSSANAGGRIVSEIFSSSRPWTMIMSFNGDGSNPSANSPDIIATDFVSIAVIRGGCGSTLGGGATQTANSGTQGRVQTGGGWNIAAIVCDASGTRYCLNGGDVTSNAANVPNANATGTHFNIGNNGTGSTLGEPLNGFIGRVTWIPTAISNGDMTSVTNLANMYGIY